RGARLAQRVPRRRRARRPVPRRRAGGPGDGPARHRGNPQRVPLVGPRRATVPAGVPDPGDGGGAPASGTPDRRGAAAMTRTPVVLQMEAVECGAGRARDGAGAPRPVRVAGGTATAVR